MLKQKECMLKRREEGELGGRIFNAKIINIFLNPLINVIKIIIVFRLKKLT